MKNILFLTLMGMGLFSCAAGPELADYPRREIDRPYNLPPGVATWSTIGFYSVEKYTYSDGTNDLSHAFIPAIPLVWRQNLSPRWNLLWAPIPVAAFYQIRSDDSATTGLSLGYGIKFSSYGYSAAAISMAYDHRQKLSKDFALEFRPMLMPWFPTGRKAKWDLQASFSSGALYQAGELFSILGGAKAVLRRDSQTVISGNIFDSSGLNISKEYHWRMVLPVYAGFNWSMARQWDFAGMLEYQKIGEDRGYSNLQLTYEFRHYW